MAAGRPKEPKKFKELKGTYQKNKDKRGLEVPHTSPHQLMSLEGLSEREKGFLGDILGFLKEFEVTHHLDKHALLLMADSYRIYQEERKSLELEGRVIEVVNNRGEVSLKTNPRVKIMFDAWDRLFKLMNEFGLTPNARARLAVVKAEEDEMDKLFDD